MIRASMIGAFALAVTPAVAQDQPYAGQDNRAIASLSAGDIAALEAGEGWGLAKPAELNGYPGPAHVLELADELDLSAEQRDAVQAIFDAMQLRARTAGTAYIEAEAHLSRMFAMGHANTAMLTAQLNDSAAALASLRNVHLSAHLEVTPLLTEAQRARYAELRGYGAGADHSDHSGHSGHGNH